MAAAWMVADVILSAQLRTYLLSLTPSATWTVNLFQNDHTPAQGDTFADYTPADFDGYFSVDVRLGDWSSVAVVDHVAISVQGTTAVFTASAIATPQTIYGYYLTDAFGNLILAERFADPVLINPNDQEIITPVLRHGVCPEPF